jgi:hypothetical protein
MGMNSIAFRTRERDYENNGDRLSRDPLTVSGRGLWSEIFLDRGGERSGEFFLKFILVKQALIFLVGDEGDFHEHRRNVRSF